MSGQKYKFTFKNRNAQMRLGNEMREELLDKSSVYQEFKEQQQQHKNLARCIKSTNLIEAKKKLK